MTKWGEEADAALPQPPVARGRRRVPPRRGLTPAPGVGIGAGTILFAVGAIAGRADVVVFGMVLVVAVAVSLARRRPEAAPDVDLTEQARDAGDPTAARIRLDVDAPDAEIGRASCRERV